VKCPQKPCTSTDPLEVHDTDQYSTYYCQGCGYEEKVVWPTPVKKKRERFDSPVAPRFPKKPRRG
jgi:Zn ribbon nucleic-acid-binding protein